MCFPGKCIKKYTAHLWSNLQAPKHKPGPESDQASKSNYQFKENKVERGIKSRTQWGRNQIQIQNMEHSTDKLICEHY